MAFLVTQVSSLCQGVDQLLELLVGDLVNTSWSVLRVWLGVRFSLGLAQSPVLTLFSLLDASNGA